MSNPFAVISTRKGLLLLDEVQKQDLGGILICDFKYQSYKKKR